MEITFKVSLYVKQFYPHDIQLQVVGDTLTVRAKHEEQVDQQGFVLREFVRKYKLPSGMRSNMVESTYSKSGVLTVIGRSDPSEGVIQNDDTSTKRLSGVFL